MYFEIHSLFVSANCMFLLIKPHQLAIHIFTTANSMCHTYERKHLRKIAQRKNLEPANGVWESNLINVSCHVGESDTEDCHLMPILVMVPARVQAKKQIICEILILWNTLRTTLLLKIRIV
jgi:hypothetical protein